MKANEAVRQYLADIGRLGGRASKGAKADAARQNGKLGGRPKGSKNKTTKL